MATSSFDRKFVVNTKKGCENFVKVCNSSSSVKKSAKPYSLTEQKKCEKIFHDWSSR